MQRFFVAMILSAISCFTLGAANPNRILTASPSAISFDSTMVGSANSASLTLTNRGNTSLKIQNVSVSGSAFSITGQPLPFTIAAGKSAILTVIFKPNAQATFQGNVSIDSNATNSPQVVAVTGSGTLPLQITTATVPDAQVGKAYQTTLSASGGTAPYQWSTAAGSSLPAGLGLDNFSGTISGTPTNAGLAN